MLAWWLARHWSCHSLTVFWSYLLGVGAVALELVLEFPDVSTSLGLGQYVPTKYVPFYMFGVAALTLAARLRSIIWHVDKAEDHIEGHIEGHIEEK